MRVCVMLNNLKQKKGFAESSVFTVAVFAQIINVYITKQ